MPISTEAKLSALPSVDEVLRTELAERAAEDYGRPGVVKAVRAALGHARTAIRRGEEGIFSAQAIAEAAGKLLAEQARPTLRPVYNLTGTVLHTNLGRAVLAEAAAQAALQAMREAVTLEYDLDHGKRGERDEHIRALLCELTGAEDATIVNNNAASVLLVLNTFSLHRETVVSRGELIEIGGSFRLPEIMERAGATLIEVGTTNRTHLKDYAAAIGPATGLVLKVHPSNYRIAGFTAAVPVAKLANLARERNVPILYDLGSGTLIDLKGFGLAHEPTIAEAIAAGADLVTFSGDKLLGGPQAGFIVGKRSLLAEINRNPLKRALRIDKIRLAAAVATLALYRNPAKLRQCLPTLRWLVRPVEEIEAIAKRLAPHLAALLSPFFEIGIVSCKSEIGSGALPLEVLPSAAIAIRPTAKRHQGQALERLGWALRKLAIPVIGRIEQQQLLLDLRCLDDEGGFLANLSGIDLSEQKGLQ
ncbi:MAG: L-seryl-tRNA(Sec) selenium transferase [Acetobacteraceae bacterium]|nr:L-seryl-tRNA(Sec) selenium transferase [Acetobacteraceae bacterium]